MDQSSFAQRKDLTGVADDLQRILKPVTPPPAFREHLRDGLRMAAEHQLTQRAPDIESPRRDGTAWSWIAGAMLLGMLIGFVAIQLRTRRRRITV